MLVTLITCTGSRPDAITLCQKYVARQTVNKSGMPIQWLIINDSPSIPIVIIPEIKALKNIEVEVVIPTQLWKEGINTQRGNMNAGIEKVKGDVIFPWEDDEYFRSDYIETMLFLLQKWDVVGQTNSKYYNIKERKFIEWRNVKHTSLVETALKKSKLDCLFRAVNSGQLFFDIMLYEILKNEQHSHFMFDHIGLVYGMKGLPGRTGIGAGHRNLDKGWCDDPFFKQLQGWLGVEDAKVYMNMAVQRG